jgi:cytochrome d ubiquinol oxidase subunit I
VLFGIPNSGEKRIDYAIEVPKLGSLILKHDLDAPLAGLDSIPDELHPPVSIIFWSFRVMVGMGLAMLGIGLWSLWCRYRGTLATNAWLHRMTVLMGPAGFVAVLAGWITTEVGRQPYTIYGHLLTADSVSPIEAPAVGASLVAFIVVYFLVFGAGTFYILRLMARLPRDTMPELDEGPLRTAGVTPGPAAAKSHGGHHGH